MENTEERYELTGPGIDDAAEAAYRFLTAARVEQKDALRVRPWTPFRRRTGPTARR